MFYYTFELFFTKFDQIFQPFSKFYPRLTNFSLDFSSENEQNFSQSHKNEQNLIVCERIARERVETARVPHASCRLDQAICSKGKSDDDWEEKSRENRSLRSLLRGRNEIFSRIFLGLPEKITAYNLFSVRFQLFDPSDGMEKKS